VRIFGIGIKHPELITDLITPDRGLFVISLRVIEIRSSPWPEV
jgi:hypothetical protein